MRVLILVFLLLSALDVLTTWYGVTSGVPEGNPVMASLLHLHGLGAMLVVRCLVTLLITLVFICSTVRYKTYRPWLLTMIPILATLFVVVNNLIVIGRLA